MDQRISNPLIQVIWKTHVQTNKLTWSNWSTHFHFWKAFLVLASLCWLAIRIFDCVIFEFPVIKGTITTIINNCRSKHHLLTYCRHYGRSWPEKNIVEIIKFVLETDMNMTLLAQLFQSAQRSKAVRIK